MIQRPRVLVATVTAHGRRIPFTQAPSYVQLASVRSAGVDFQVHSGYMVDKGREALAERSLEGGYSHILFLDDDIVPPPGVVDRLLGWRYPAVTAAYQRRTGGLAAGLFEDEETLRWKPLPWPVPGEVAMVTASGAGCLLLDTRIFRRMSRPWFVYDQDGSEDMHFCKKLILELGIPVLLDAGAPCGHEMSTVVLPGGEAEIMYRR